MSNLSKKIAIAFLARGSDRDWFLSCERFLNSYKLYQSGCDHSFYVLFKGFTHDSDLERAKELFKTVVCDFIYLEDTKFDIGAYIEWAKMIEEEFICVFSTSSEILSSNWLFKLTNNLMMPKVGLVGATASYESLNTLNSLFPVFPNVHIRSSAFMIRRDLFCSIAEGMMISTKMDAYHFESGQKSLTRQVLARGKNILLVGSNGRGYSPQFWATSETFRQGKQGNLLVADNQTRKYSSCNGNKKRELVVSTWGKYIEIRHLLEKGC